MTHTLVLVGSCLKDFSHPTVTLCDMSAHLQRCSLEHCRVSVNLRPRQSIST